MKVKNSGNRRVVFMRNIIWLLLLTCTVLAAVPGEGARRIKIMPIGTSITAACNECPSHRYFMWKELVDLGLAERVDFVGIYCGVGSPESSIGGMSSRCGAPPFTEYNGNEWDWDHNGIPSVTIPGILSRFPELSAGNTPDIACIELGTNDLFKYFNIDSTTARMDRLIDSLRVRNPNVVILLGKMIPMATANQNLLNLNERYATLAAAKTTVQSPIFIVDQFTGFSPSTMLLDALHPNPAGQLFMAGKWMEVLRPVLEQFVGIQTVSLQSLPVAGSTVIAGTPVRFTSEVAAFSGVASAQLYCNGQVVANGLKSGTTTFSFTHTPKLQGNLTYHVEVTDAFGATAATPELALEVVNGEPADYTIMEIQGSGFASVLEGRWVRTTGIVTLSAYDSSYFWIQDGTGDGITVTSDGLAICNTSPSTSSYRPRQGDLVKIVGVVEEYTESSRFEPVTQITGIDSIIVISSNNPLPSAFPLSVLPGSPNDREAMMREYEKREGMILRLSSATVTSPVDDAGHFSVALQGNSAGASMLFPAASGSGPLFINRPWISGQIDYNTECLLMGTRTVAANNVPLLHSGNSISACYGVLDYEDGFYLLQPSPQHFRFTPTAPYPMLPLYTTPASAQTLRIASVNFGALFDGLNATDKCDAVSSETERTLKTGKIINALTNELGLSEIVCVQGVENEELLIAVASGINSAAAARYKAICLSGTGASGLENGFLYDSLQVELVEAYQIPGDEFTGEGSNPLAGLFFIDGKEWTVINIALVNRQGDDRLFSPGVQPLRPSEFLRVAQARRIRDFVNQKITADPTAYVAIAGLVNDLSFNESDEAVCASELLKGDLLLGEQRFTALSDLPAGMYWYPYTAMVHGRGEMTSDIFISPALADIANHAGIYHFNASFDRRYSAHALHTIGAFKDDPLLVRFNRVP